MGMIIRIGFIFLVSLTALDVYTSKIGTSLSINNSFNKGLILRKDTEHRLGTTFGFFPFISFEPFYDNKKLKISLDQKLNIWWLDDNRVSLDDLFVRASSKDMLAFKKGGLSLTPTLEIELPASSASRKAHKIFGLGIYAALAWSKSGFSLSYKPSLSAYINGELKNNTYCDRAFLEPPSSCTSVRQTRALIKNMFQASYERGNHKVKAMFRTYHRFLKPMAFDSRNLKTKTLGLLEYKYSFATRYPTSLMIGSSSFQPLHDEKGFINFPFKDLFSLNKFATRIYCEIEVATP